MTNITEKELQIDRLLLEQKKVEAGKQELMFRKKERQLDIQKIEANIAISDNRINELDSMIKKLKEEK